MSSNEIIQQIMEKVMKAIEMCQGEEAMRQTAYQVEKNLIAQLLSLGKSLLQLYFQSRANSVKQGWQINQAGKKVGYHSQKKRQYLSLFGEIAIERPYYYEAGEGGYSPLEEVTQMPRGKYSELVREMHSELAVNMPYRTATNFLKRYLGIGLSSRVVTQFINEAGEQVRAYHEQKEAPKAETEAEILVAQADGKGIPMIIPTETKGAVRAKPGQARSRKKEAIVTALYSIAPRPRTATDIVKSLFQGEPTPHQDQKHQTTPCNKMIWGTLASKDEGITHLKRQVALRKAGTAFTHHVALTDGAHSLQYHVQEKLPQFTLILDFIHVVEYLWKAANAVYDDCAPERDEWVKERALALLEGRLCEVVDTLHTAQEVASTSAKQQQLAKVAAYFERNAPFMIYDVCLTHGWPIASGVIEGACRHVVKDRFEQSGMRWEQSCAQRLLDLRCIYHSDCWDDYFHFRRRSLYPSLPLAA